MKKMEYSSQPYPPSFSRQILCPPSNYPCFLFNLLLVLCLCITSLTSFAADGFSEINNALFDSAHMKNISEPGTISYQYIKTQTGKNNRQDTIKVNVKNLSKSGRTDQSYDFFTGEHKRPYTARSNVLGNAIFMLFLEWDIHELERETEGSWRHFQRRIRWAMAKGAQKKGVEINHNGEIIKGIEYSIQPYANDKKSKRYGSYANTYYIFTLAENIPGTIYEIRVIVPKEKNWKEGDEVLSEKHISYKDFVRFTKNN